MKCFKCDSTQDAAYFSEMFSCGHCDEENLLEYNICSECGWMWRSVNGEPLEGSQIHSADMPGFVQLLSGEQPELTEEDEKIMEKVTAHLEKLEKMETGEFSMADFVHKCLECNSTAVDVIDGKYTCTDCGFGWEVVKFE